MRRGYHYIFYSGLPSLRSHIPHRERSFPHASQSQSPGNRAIRIQEARARKAVNARASHPGSAVLILFSFPCLSRHCLYVTMSLKRQADFLYGDTVPSSPLKKQCRTFHFLVAEDPSAPINRPRDKSLGRTIILRVHEGDDYPFHTQDFWVPFCSPNFSYGVWGKILILGPL